MKSEKLRRVMDTHLPGVENGAFEQKVLRRIRAERPRGLPRRGWTLALALGALLALSATAVAAALLSAREVAEDYALPMSSAAPGEAFTVEQTRELMALAEENDLILSENAQQNLAKMLSAGEGAYKDELLRAIAKAEFGPDPAAWTMEQQAWFDDVLVTMGLLPEHEKTMPEKGEDGRAWAIALAEDHLRTAYGETADLQDESVYDPAGVQYLTGGAGDELEGPCWSVCFIPREGEEAALTAAEYWVYLDDEGNILGDARRPGAEPGVLPMWVTDAYKRCYGSDRAAWPQAVWRSYRAAMLQCAATPDDKYFLLCLELSSFPDIADNALPREEAAQRALHALGMAEAQAESALYLGAEPHPLWNVTLRLPDGTRYTAEVDSVTGEVLRLEPYPLRDHCHLFLQTTREEAEELYQQYLETVPSHG